MTHLDAPFDDGLQPERTLLAWRRTALSLAVASAVGLRLTIADFGAVAVIVGVLGVMLSMGAYLAASARYRRVHRSLIESEALTTGGTTLSAVAAASVLLGGVALAWVLVGGVGS